MDPWLNWRKPFEQTFVYGGIYSAHRERVHGRPVGALSQHRFLGFIQNHDQVGNRALGDRITESAGVDRAKIAAALVLLGPFIPMIFQGEEWAASTPFLYFADHDDRELARQVSEGRKREFAAFGWDPASIPDPEKRETFDRSKLDWQELSGAAHADMLAWYRRLIQLRQSTACLNNGEPGNVTVRFSEDQKWFCMRRGSIVVACNLAATRQPVPIPAGAEVLFASGHGAVVDDRIADLSPDSVVIVSIKETL